MGEALKFLRQNLSNYELVILLFLTGLAINYSFSIGVFSNLVVN